LSDDTGNDGAGIW